jgi:hypothetical protein
LRADGGGGGGRALLRRLASRALAEDLVQRPVGETQQGGREEAQRGRHIPQRGGGGKASELGLERAAELEASFKALLQRWFVGESTSKGEAVSRTGATDCELTSAEELSRTGFIQLTGHIPSVYSLR